MKEEGKKEKKEKDNTVISEARCIGLYFVLYKLQKFDLTKFNFFWTVYRIKDIMTRNRRIREVKTVFLSISLSISWLIFFFFFLSSCEGLQEAWLGSDTCSRLINESVCSGKGNYSLISVVICSFLCVGRNFPYSKDRFTVTVTSLHTHLL